MFNYEVNPAVLQSHLPPHTQLDLHEGKAIVSVVGFLFNNVRVRSIQWPGFANFEEVNLRYYIKYFDGEEWKRGVGFISEIVPKSLISTIANFFYNEHYSTAEMSHDIVHKSETLEVTYRWKKKNQDWNTMWLSAHPKLNAIEPNSQEEFIFEHYFGYNKLSETTTIEYALAHPRWQLYEVNEYKLSCNIEKLYGAAFAPFIQEVKPLTVFLAKGSEVEVRTPRKLFK